MQLFLTSDPGLCSVEQDRKDQHLEKSDLGGQGCMYFSKRDLKLTEHCEQVPGYVDVQPDLA